MEVMIVKGISEDNCPPSLKGTLHPKEYPIIISEEANNKYAYIYKNGPSENWSEPRNIRRHHQSRNPTSKEERLIIGDYIKWRMNK